MATDRSIKDKRYEEKHKEERKAKYMIWGTSVPRKYAEEINEFLAKYCFTKVQLIEAGFKALIDEAAETDTSLAKNEYIYTRKKYRRTFCEEERQTIR